MRALVVCLVLLALAGGCANTTGSVSDESRFIGTWKLVDYASGGTGFSFTLNQTVVFRADRSFTDNTTRYTADAITGLWSLPEEDRLLLTSSSAGVPFVGGLDWEYALTNSGTNLTLTRGTLVKQLQKISGVALVSP